jgi:hypothetical protein
MKRKERIFVVNRKFHKVKLFFYMVGKLKFAKHGFTWYSTIEFQLVNRCVPLANKNQSYTFALSF